MFGHHAVSLSAIALVLAGMATAYILQTQRAQAADSPIPSDSRRAATTA
jgi:two-component system cell cycle sensor histidine kinase PleC